MACLCTAMFMLALPWSAARSQDGAWQGSLAMSSQLVDRGLAIGSSTPTLQGALSWASDDGWTIGGAIGAPLRRPGDPTEALVQVARSWRASASSQLQASLVYYDYPAVGAMPAYRRVEGNASWIYRDVLVLNAAALRPLNVPGAKTAGAVDVSLRWPLAAHLSLRAGLGEAQFQHRYGYHGDRLDWYGYGNLGLAWEEGSWRVEATRIATRDAPRQRPGTGGLSPWLATVAWSF